MKKLAYIIIAVLLSSSVTASIDLDATFLSQDPDPVEPGEFVDLRWKIENTGSEDLINAYVRIKVSYPFTIEESSRKNLGTLSAIQEGEKSSIIKYRVRVDENAVQGEEEIKLFQGAANFAGEIVDKIMINIQTRQVVFGIKAIDIYPENPAPGDTAQINITIQNLNDPFLQNVKVKLDLKGTDIATIGSIDEKILKRLLGNSEATISFTVFIGANAESKIHQIPLRVDYSDKFSREKTLNSYFGLRIEAPPEYLINLEESSVYVAKKVGRITLSISNIGIGNLNYVAMEVMPSDDYDVISNNQIYLGNLESDDFETGEFDIYIPQYKKLIPIKTKITFKDSFNKPHEDIIEIPIRIYTASEASSLGLIKKRNPIGYIILVLLIVGGIYYYRKKKKAKKS